MTPCDIFLFFDFVCSFLVNVFLFRFNRIQIALFSLYYWQWKGLILLEEKS
jgi:hypothetical protein